MPPAQPRSLLPGKCEMPQCRKPFDSDSGRFSFWDDFKNAKRSCHHIVCGLCVGIMDDPAKHSCASGWYKPRCPRGDCGKPFSSINLALSPSKATTEEFFKFVNYTRTGRISKDELAAWYNTNFDMTWDVAMTEINRNWEFWDVPQPRQYVPVFFGFMDQGDLDIKEFQQVQEFMKDSLARSFTSEPGDAPSLPRSVSQGERLLKSFQSFDQNGDGIIDRGEFLNGLHVMSSFDTNKWTEERVDRMFAAADGNKDGKIQYEEFVIWASTKSEDKDDFLKFAEPLPEAACNELIRKLSFQSKVSSKNDLVAPLQVLHDAAWDQKEPAIALLLKIVQNVVKNPTDPKFRTLQMSNASLKAKLFPVPGCTELLMAVGFEAQGEEQLVLPDGVDIAWVAAELSAFGDQELVDRKRAERDEKISKVKYEESKRKKLKGEFVGGAAEERKQMLAKIEYDRQERVAVARE